MVTKKILRFILLEIVKVPLNLMKLQNNFVEKVCKLSLWILLTNTNILRSTLSLLQLFLKIQITVEM